MEVEPQVAFQGDVVYVAFSRIAPNEGCGSNGADVGVYVRSRRLPDGAWSAATRVGVVADRLQSFDVASATLHATVENGGHVYYESLNGARYHRYLLTGAIRSSLRVGSDGRARIAYEATAGLLYAVFTGSRLSTSRVPGTTSRDWAPVLTLDAGDKAHLLWSRSPAPGGCAVPPPQPDDGIYYATNASGAWVSHRITTDIGPASLQVDKTTGRVHVLAVGDQGPTYYTTASNGHWTRTVVAAASAQSPVLRLDPSTGTLLVVYVDGDGYGYGPIYLITKI